MYNNPPIVSIAVPVYNVSSYIERCARSLFEQTYKAIEFVFINDGSTDNSISILKAVLNEYPQQLLNTTIIDRKENHGVAATRNELLSHCHGEFVMFVDADDYLDKDIVKSLVSVQANNDVDIVSFGFIINKNGKETKVSIPETEKSDEYLQFLITQGSNHELFCRLFRTKMLRDNNIHFQEGLNIGEDWLFMVKCLFYAQDIQNVNIYGYHYNRDNVASAMSTYKELKKQIEDLRIFREIFFFLQSVKYESNQQFLDYFADKVLWSKWEASKRHDYKSFTIISELHLGIFAPFYNFKNRVKDTIKWLIMSNYQFASFSAHLLK